MALEEVERILGKGELLKKKFVPQYSEFSRPPGDRLQPIVSGEEVYIWRHPINEREIFVGTTGGKVVDKRFRELSL
jgi:hypothetical protein